MGDGEEAAEIGEGDQHNGPSGNHAAVLPVLMRGCTGTMASALSICDSLSKRSGTRHSS
ncbi:hypothetical protein D3C87_1881020 [compost metagenome]